VRLNAGFRSCRHRDRAVHKLCVEPLVELLAKLCDDTHGARIINDDTVPEHRRRPLFAGNGVVVLVKNDDDDVGRAEIDADLVAAGRRLEGFMLRRFNFADE